MKTFGKSKGGGRRDAARAQAPVLVLLSTAAADFRAALVNISECGAQLSAPELPLQGEPIVFTAAGAQSFARVIWRDGNLCGVEFEENLEGAQVERLSSQGDGLPPVWLSVVEPVCPPKHAVAD